MVAVLTIDGAATRIQDFHPNAFMHSGAGAFRTFSNYAFIFCLLSLRNLSLFLVDRICIDCGTDAGERVYAAVLSDDGSRV